MHHFLRILPVVCLLAVACNNAPRQGHTDTPAQQSADTLGGTHIVPPADAYLEQLSSQDTLFADGSKPTDWDAAGFDDPLAFKKFLILFKEWVRNDNADSVAAYVRYPLKQYKNAAEFKQAYPAIFNEKVKKAVQEQRLDEIFRNYQGAMLGAGAIWFTSGKEGYRVIAVNN